MSNPNIETAAKVVSVGCKLPNGLHLDMKANDGAVIRHTVKGANAARIVGGYGITENIPAEFMQAWLKRNAKHPAVVSGSIFIHDDAKSAESFAKERREIATGLEPIDPVKSGMLRGPDGQVDPAALKQYNDQKATNPARARQQAE